MVRENGSGVAVKRRLDPTVATARNELRAALAPWLESGDTPLVLIACSGGADSLALAGVAEYFNRVRSDGTRALRVGAVVVDHGLQPETREVSVRTAQALGELGLDPVIVKSVTVESGRGLGPEASARAARYAAFAEACAETGAELVLLGHTLNDQAEQVLLGLARGSGTRSLSGMPVANTVATESGQRVNLLRPFINLTRGDTEHIAGVFGFEPWQDPDNSNPRFARSRVRTEVLPYLEAQLGPGVAKALHRSAAILAADVDFIDQHVDREFARIARESEEGLLLAERDLREAPKAIRARLLARAVVHCGGEQPTQERISAAETLLARTGSAGPVQMSGKVSVWRQVRGKTGREYGNLVFKETAPPGG